MSLQGLVAQRFAGKPLRQPRYSMRHVPHALPNLENSAIYYVDQREHFTDSMSEMVLLCNQVMKTKAMKTGKGAGKPLSLEYIADRCDVDDPIFGYMIRTSKKDSNHPSCDSHWQEGMMQGFVTCTTFTNWQKSFEWDSLHDSAFAYDDTDLAEQMVSERKYDKDGSLAQELQNTVRCGDPWNEGIVWPRIAEISLLGAMGCGKALLNLVIEKLECMPPSSKFNYDYIVLQATNNSIPFYESMGFIRVGCITENNKRQTESENRVSESEGGSPSPPRSRHHEKSPDSPSHNSEVVSSPVIKVFTEEHGETVLDYANKYKCDPWDILFLTEPLYPGITLKSPLKKGTQLFIPDTSLQNGDIAGGPGGSGGSVQWYYCKDNETPREISERFGADVKDLLTANRGRIEGLQMHSKLIEGTKIQVSGFDRHHDDFVPYCHWTFPDSEFEDGEPSYMMARKLNRKTGAAARERPVENSFACKVMPYDPMSIPAVLNARTVEAPIKHATPERKQDSKQVSKKRKRLPDQPLTPKKPRGAFFTFLNDEKDRLQKKDLKISMPDLTKISSQRWKNMSDEEKEQYIEQDKRERSEYHRQMQLYKLEMKEFKKKYSYSDATESNRDSSDTLSKKLKKLQYKNLFNKVVKLNSDGQLEAGDEFKYYYVLTYIPDLFWCHLAPMRQDGFFSQKSRSVGRPKWKLIHEGAGKELDISADVCEVVKARTMRGCADADKEEWDILDDQVELDFSNIVIPSETVVCGSQSPKSVTVADDNMSSSAMSVAESMKENDIPSTDMKPKQPRLIHGRTPRASKSRTVKHTPPKSVTTSKSTPNRSKLMNSFDIHIEELRKFKEQHGHCRVPKSYKQNISLSNWISNLNYSRSLSIKGLPATIKLSEDRLEKLSELGFEFTLMEVGSRGGGQVRKGKQSKTATDHPVEYPPPSKSSKMDATAASVSYSSTTDDPCSSEDTMVDKASVETATENQELDALSLPDMPADTKMDFMISPMLEKVVKGKQNSKTKKGGFIQMSIQKYFKM